MSFTTKTKNSLLILLFPLLSAWSCEKAPLEEFEITEQPNPQMEAVPECPVGNLRYFTLDVHYEGQYVVEIPPLPSYDLIKDCMCHMQYLQIDFSALPDAQYISVTDVYNVPVPFVGPVSVPSQSSSTTPAFQYIQVYTDDPHQVLHVEIDPAGEVDSELIRSGGFCLIDNLSGPYPNDETVFNEPYLQVDPNTFRIEMWVPTSITAAP